MSRSNPASGAKEAASAYREAMLGLVGDRDPLDVLAELPDYLKGATRGLTEDELRRPEAPGKWSIVQVIQHMADTEVVFGFRMRMALGGNEPRLPGFDQDLWAERLHYDGARLEEALSLLLAVRGANLHLARRLTPGDLARAGIHEERGRETVDHMLGMMAGHDLAHRSQVDRIRKGL